MLKVDWNLESQEAKFSVESLNVLPGNASSNATILKTPSDPATQSVNKFLDQIHCGDCLTFLPLCLINQLIQS